MMRFASGNAGQEERGNERPDDAADVSEAVEMLLQFEGGCG